MLYFYNKHLKDFLVMVKKNIKLNSIILIIFKNLWYLLKIKLHELKIKYCIYLFIIFHLIFKLKLYSILLNKIILFITHFISLVYVYKIKKL